MGRKLAVLSIAVSSDAAKFLNVSISGRGLPAFGIKPTRTLRIIFSVSSGVFSTCARSNCASDILPDLFLSLWQPTQYLLISALSTSIVIGAEFVDAAAAAD